MSREIDLTRGGYGGDSIEEEFKYFTSEHMEYWWHFREVLRATDRKSNSHWKMIKKSEFSDDDHKKLIAVSLLNYAVYTGIAEALSFHEDLESNISKRRLLYMKRDWKSLYSSLYSSFNAFCNLTYVIVFNESPFGNKDTPWNKSPSEVLRKVNSENKTTIAKVIENCKTRLDIRDHLDHWWTIWTHLSQDQQTGEFRYKLDHNFTKGYIVLEAEDSIDWNIAIDVVQRATEDITGCADDFNRIYKEMAKKGGYLDNYLSQNGWCIDYSDFGTPHNSQRPLP